MTGWITDKVARHLMYKCVPRLKAFYHLQKAVDAVSVGYYYLTHLLKYSGMSTIYLAYGERTQQAVVLKQVNEAPQTPSRLNPVLTRAVDTVILHALRKDPQNVSRQCRFWQTLSSCPPRSSHA